MWPATYDHTTVTTLVWPATRDHPQNNAFATIHCSNLTTIRHTETILTSVCSVPGSFFARNEAFVIAHFDPAPTWRGEDDTEMPIGLFFCPPGGLCFRPFFIAFVNCSKQNGHAHKMSFSNCLILIKFYNVQIYSDIFRITNRNTTHTSEI